MSGIRTHNHQTPLAQPHCWKDVLCKLFIPHLLHWPKKGEEHCPLSSFCSNSIACITVTLDRKLQLWHATARTHQIWHNEKLLEENMILVSIHLEMLAFDMPCLMNCSFWKTNLYIERYCNFPEISKKCKVACLLQNNGAWMLPNWWNNVKIYTQRDTSTEIHPLAEVWKTTWKN